jgi:hypothetical protein
VHLELQISSRILEKVADGAVPFIRGSTGGDDLLKKCEVNNLVTPSL